MVTRELSPPAPLAATSMTCPTILDPLGISIPFAVAAVPVVLMTTGSPFLASFVSSLFSNSPVTGRSAGLVISGLSAVPGPGSALGLLPGSGLLAWGFLGSGLVDGCDGGLDGCC